MTLPERLAAGAGFAALITLTARRARLLTTGGALAAFVSGTVATAAGWTWAAALLTFFTTSVLLSRWRRQARVARTADVVEKSGARDAWQVGANGGVFAAFGAASLVIDHPVVQVAGLGAIAASTADTWATEIGTAIGGTPRSITGFRQVAPGTSGGISGVGTLAMFGGAAAMGTVAVVVGFEARVALAIAAGGVSGAVADTLLGATLQARRWCPACGCTTEQSVHRCGAASTRAGGMAAMTNDTVNLVSTLVGAVVAAWVASLR
ncbi:MAG: DUF92 domain-containing protein [Gemmatimonadaceae bacterium]|nr:DUF92 domain-containing protein [Gemmatimonadaceae bacterium]